MFLAYLIPLTILLSKHLKMSYHSLNKTYKLVFSGVIYVPALSVFNRTSAERTLRDTTKSSVISKEPFQASSFTRAEALKLKLCKSACIRASSSLLEIKVSPYARKLQKVKARLTPTAPLVVGESVPKSWFLFYGIAKMLIEKVSLHKILISMVNFNRHSKINRNWLRVSSNLLSNTTRDTFYKNLVYSMSVSLLLKNTNFVESYIINYLQKTHYRLHNRLAKFLVFFVQSSAAGFLFKLFSIKGFSLVMKGKLGVARNFRSRTISINRGSYSLNNALTRCAASSAKSSTLGGVVGLKIKLAW